ncbi:hypothetical protein [Methylobacterium indicum]|uniref:Uncharacterized protein n=1 Tax=Methylobacterium indicum TaxID=1775910 RepID=A0A8H8WYG2_9HYPH|nr:hypothetical protein [Methylobacterium indicum]BCM86262.1 hypothetical protein mvi_47230 [Methylobacterium indicum]
MADDLPAAFDAGDVVARSRLLADFTDLTFRPLAAPYAAASSADRHLPILDSVTKADRQARKKMRRFVERQAARSDG